MMFTCHFLLSRTSIIPFNFFSFSFTFSTIQIYSEFSSKLFYIAFNPLLCFPNFNFFYYSNPFFLPESYIIFLSLRLFQFIFPHSIPLVFDFPVSKVVLLNLFSFSTSSYNHLKGKIYKTQFVNYLL